MFEGICEKLSLPEPNFVSGRLEPNTPVRIILNGEERVADATATGKRDHKGNYIIKYVDRNGRKHRMILNKWYVLLP